MKSEQIKPVFTFFFTLFLATLSLSVGIVYLILTAQFLLLSQIIIYSLMIATPLAVLLSFRHEDKVKPFIILEACILMVITFLLLYFNINIIILFALTITYFYLITKTRQTITFFIKNTIWPSVPNLKNNHAEVEKSTFTEQMPILTDHTDRNENTIETTLSDNENNSMQSSGTSRHDTFFSALVHENSVVVNDVGETQVNPKENENTSFDMTKPSLENHNSKNPKTTKKYAEALAANLTNNQTQTTVKNENNDPKQYIDNSMEFNTLMHNMQKLAKYQYQVPQKENLENNGHAATGEEPKQDIVSDDATAVKNAEITNQIKSDDEKSPIISEEEETAIADNNLTEQTNQTQNNQESTSPLVQLYCSQ